MQLHYDVVYSDRKTVQITVERDRSVVVRAPRTATSEQIDGAVQQKKLWIYQKLQHPQKYQPEQLQQKKEFVSGESLLYLGRHYRLEVVEEAFSDVRFDGRFYLSKQAQPEAARLFEAWFKAQARKKITPIAQEIASRLGVGYHHILISDLRYRWGSCTPNDSLNFNWRLVKAPMTVVQYVVAHELAHLMEPNHTERFWNLVRIQAPRYEKAKAWLRRNGHDLEVDF
ncbi:MAG: M48 family metallopeptidase [Rhodothermales bacterium]